MSSNTFSGRVANLDGSGLTGANGAAVLKAAGPNATASDDADEDVLRGGDGADWFPANVAGGVKRDRLLDLSAFESGFVDDLELHGPQVGP